MIKENVVVQKASKDSVKQLPKHVIRITISTIITVAFIIGMILVGISGVQIIRARAAEDREDYDVAAVYYENSLWPVPIPGIKQHIIQMKQLAESKQNFTKAQNFIKKGDIISAMVYLNLVDPLDSHYIEAQQLKRQIESQ